MQLEKKFTTDKLIYVIITALIMIFLNCKFDPELDGISTEIILDRTFSICVIITVIFSAIIVMFVQRKITLRIKEDVKIYRSLGMTDNQILKVYLKHEAQFFVLTTLVGIAVGMLLAKFVQLCFVNVLSIQPSTHVYISIKAMGMTVFYVSIIFTIATYWNIVTLLYGNYNIRFHIGKNSSGMSNTIANSIASIILIALACGMSFMADTPTKALTWVFPYVIFMGAGILLLFMYGISCYITIVGNITNNKNKTNSYINILFLRERFTRLGVWLTLITGIIIYLICNTILAVSLFVREDYIERNITHDYAIHIYDKELDDKTEIESEIKKLVADNFENVCNVNSYEYNTFVSVLKDDTLNENVGINDVFSILSYDAIANVYIMSIDTYNLVKGQDIKIDDDQAVMYCNGVYYDKDNIFVGDSCELSIVKNVDSFDLDVSEKSQIDQILLFVNNPQEIVNASEIDMDSVWLMSFDSANDRDEQFNDAIVALRNRIKSEDVQNDFNYVLLTKENNKKDFVSVYGGMSFVCIVVSILGITFMCFIIRFMWEYELDYDKKNLIVLEHLGVTRDKAKKMIRKQLEFVFALPLLVALFASAVFLPMLYSISKLL